jgi:transcriptional regulator with XRE-family HTH domain
VKTFAQLLAQYIDERGMKQTRVASAAQISNNYLLRLLAGGRHPSEQVVTRLAGALRLTAVQTGALLVAAGYTPPLDLLEPPPGEGLAGEQFPLPDEGPVALLIKQLYSLEREVPEALQAAFLAEMQRYLAYARYRYVLCGGASLLDLELGTLHPDHGGKARDGA